MRRQDKKLRRKTHCWRPNNLRCDIIMVRSTPDGAAPVAAVAGIEASYNQIPKAGSINLILTNPIVRALEASLERE
jgi:hypothetical protein